MRRIVHAIQLYERGARLTRKIQPELISILELTVKLDSGLLTI